MTAYPDRLPAILQAMQDAAHEAGDLVLAAGIASAIDLDALALLLPLTGVDEANGRGLHAIVAGDASRHVDACSFSAADRALAARVAARLASTACLLLAVDSGGHEETAWRLWATAARLIGMTDDDESDNEPLSDADKERLEIHLRIAEEMARKELGWTVAASAQGVTFTFPKATTSEFQDWSEWLRRALEERGWIEGETWHGRASDSEDERLRGVLASLLPRCPRA